jgi:nucleoid-associated protein YgaU
MARETRIGLLVALVFIIAFGLVLSELTGRPSPAGKQIRSAIERVNHSDYAPIVARVPAEDAAPPEVSDQASGDGPVLAEAPQEEVPPLTLAARMPPMIDVSIVPPAQPPAGEVTMRFHAPPQGVRRGLTYVIQPGDSLGKIAREHYGDEGRYMAIFEANKDVLADPSLVVVGQEIVLPKLGEPTDAVAAVLPGPNVPSAPGQGRQPRPVVASGELPVVPPPGAGGTKVMDLDQLARHFGTLGVGETKVRKPSGRVYVVREGDNLTKIARETMKDGSTRAVNRLFEANRDRLKSPDNLLIGQELNIPT